MKFNSLIYGIILFFTLLMALIIARSFTAPMEQLSRDADRISSGDMTAKFLTQDNQGKDEIGILSRSLVTMSQKLINVNKDLEADVRKRTRELEKRLAELELFNKVTTGREIQMIELKKKINQLSKKLYLEEPYDLSFLNDKRHE